jgi:hypothetical protein
MQAMRSPSVGLAATFGPACAADRVRKHVLAVDGAHGDRVLCPIPLMRVNVRLDGTF